MSAITFSPSESRLHSILSDPYTMPQVPSSLALEAAAPERRMSTAHEGTMALPTVFLRRLPRNTTAEAVRTMLLFAKDLQNTDIVPNEYEEDAGFATAVARFASMTGASEAQAMLDGKPNTAGQAKMIVTVISSPSMAARRNTIDPMAGRRMAQSVSPTQTNATKSSRFNGTFQSMDKNSPPMGSPPDFSSSESGSHLQTIFSPQMSGTSVVTDRSRNSGKTVIDEDGGDDDTGELLKDPLAYMNNSSAGNAGRKHVNPRVPTAAFSSLSLNTTMGSAPSHAYASPRSAAQSRTPHSQFSPGMGANGQYSSPSQPFVRHNFPPANPADQNPPCNTLYVGNLPIDTSEDELKAMFSKQRGYKRLCFRTKQNGPMCFVEFEDVSFATKALNDLYGAQLHNSVKGGIRLSFSKNPLGVRSGQPVSVNPTTPLSATGAMSMSGFGNMTPGAFSTAAGPPPGLSAPPGLNMSMPPGVNGGVPPSAYVPQGYTVGNGALPNMRAVSMHTGPASQNVGGGYPDYMLGR